MEFAALLWGDARDAVEASVAPSPAVLSTHIPDVGSMASSSHEQPRLSTLGPSADVSAAQSTHTAPRASAASEVANEASMDGLSEGGISAVSDIAAARSTTATLMQVEGMLVYREEYSGFHGRYHRYKVKCPHNGSCHKEKKGTCEKKRGDGPAQHKNFGPMEPLGFLGAWAAARSRFPNRKEHVGHSPKLHEVRHYMVANGLL